MEELLEVFIKNPETIVPVVKAYIDKYKPVVYDLAKEVVDVQRDYSNNTECPAIKAKIKKNMYDAYMNAGFTEDQAFALMINDNIQLMENIKRLSSNKISTKNVNI